MELKGFKAVQKSCLKTVVFCLLDDSNVKAFSRECLLAFTHSQLGHLLKFPVDNDV